LNATQLHNQFFAPHTPYIQNYKHVPEFKLKLVNSKPVFATFLKFLKLIPVLEGKTLDDYLIIPVQRIPRYILLLTDLMKHTTVSHGDYKSVQKALLGFQELALFINENQRRADNITALTERLQGYDVRHAKFDPSCTY
jgi:hypothetical protein